MFGIFHGPMLLHQEYEGFLILEVELTIKLDELFRGVFHDLHGKDEVWRNELEPGLEPGLEPQARY